MSTVFINPGSGPVNDASWDYAYNNIWTFVRDLEFPEKSVLVNPVPAGEKDGRFRFDLYLNEKRCEVLMPGIPIEKVRYLNKPDQNIWDFPRLYINGSSWVWNFALDAAKRRLTEE